MGENRSLLKNRYFWIASLIIFTTGITIYYGSINWTSLITSVDIVKEDNLIVRSLVSNTAFLGVFRLLSVICMIVIVLASIALLIKFFTAAVVKLWGLEIKSETIQFEEELKRKDNTIEQLETDNNILRETINAIQETLETTESVGAKDAKRRTE